MYDKDPIEKNCPICETSLKKELTDLFNDLSEGYREKGSIECPNCGEAASFKAYWNVTFVEYLDD